MYSIYCNQHAARPTQCGNFVTRVNSPPTPRNPGFLPLFLMRHGNGSCGTTRDSPVSMGSRNLAWRHRFTFLEAVWRTCQRRFIKGDIAPQRSSCEEVILYFRIILQFLLRYLLNVSFLTWRISIKGYHDVPYRSTVGLGHHGHCWQWFPVCYPSSRPSWYPLLIVAAFSVMTKGSCQAFWQAMHLWQDSQRSTQRRLDMEAPHFKAQCKCQQSIQL